MPPLEQTTNTLLRGFRAALGSKGGPAMTRYKVLSPLVRHFSKKREDDDLIVVPIQKIQDLEDASRRLKESLPQKMVVDTTPNKAEVLKFVRNDIEEGKKDQYREAVVITGDGLVVKYGERGVSATEKRKPEDLLTKSKTLPPGEMAVVSARTETPIKFVAKNPKTSVVLPLSEMGKVYEHKENKERYSLNLITRLHPGDAKRLSLKVQTRIYDDKNREDFYEEVTSKVYPPTQDNKSSGTLMNFETMGKSQGSTGMHFHPGERSLIIMTSNRNSGVILNFCGTEENPDERKDSEVIKHFPKNSILVLNFPANTHHKFLGDFTCLSIHPREGDNLIDAVSKGTLPAGFLESATVFSRGKVKEPKNPKPLTATKIFESKEKQKQ